jgi:hypothetical protein
MSDRDPDALIYQVLQGEADQKHGEGILSSIDDANKRREDADRALLDALNRAREPEDEAKSGGSGDAAA